MKGPPRVPAQHAGHMLDLTINGGGGPVTDPIAIADDEIGTLTAFGGGSTITIV